MLPPVALVTGGAQRIGRAIALDLAAAGFNVAIHYNRARAPAEELVAEITRQFGNCGGSAGEDGGKSPVRALALRCDFTRMETLSGLISRVEEALGPVGLLINNAAIFEAGDWEEADWPALDRHFRINCQAPALLARELARRLPDDACGLIINMLDQRVRNLTPRFIAYTASKYALWGLTQTLAMALAPRVRVNAIGPGPILPSARQSTGDFDRQWQATPLNRRIAAPEIAAAIRFLIASHSMTGQLIMLDNGQHLGWQQVAVPPPPE